MLKRIQLNNFGKHKEISIELKSGLNAVIGENRSGKTQTLESICFAYFGKTKNSKLEKIINFDSDKAEVSLEDEFNKIKRSRTNSGSSLSGIKKHELEEFLGLAYAEFLSIFYISSHEQKSLFDSAYLRQFLISIFDLDKYAKVYNKLKFEYTALKDLDKDVKTFNKVILKNRIDRVKKILNLDSVKRDKINKKQRDLNNSFTNLRLKEAEIASKRREIKKKYNLIKEGKCPECNRAYEKLSIENSMKKIKALNVKLNNYDKVLNKKKVELNNVANKLNSALDKVDKRIYRSRRIITILGEKLKLEKPKVNMSRIKELEKVLPILNPKGFPSYLLEVYIPVITDTANQLLKIIFPDMEISIRTERPESNKPDFKPYIKRGDEILELKDLCGSEIVLVNLCFRLGIIVIFKQLCETGIDFLMVDEGFERIDNANSLKVISLLENFISMGYLSQVILVTHKDILKEQESINYIELGDIHETA